MNPLVSLQDSLNQPENREVLPLPHERAEHRRTSICGSWPWTSSTARRGSPPSASVSDVPRPAARTRTGSARRCADHRDQTTISAAGSYRQNWLPLPYPATRVDIDGRWRFEPEGRTLVGDRGQTTRGAQYQVTSLLVEPTAEQLAARAGRARRSLQREYTQVPDSLPAVVERRPRER